MENMESIESQIDDRPLSLADLGIAPSSNLRTTFLGRRRSAESLSRLEWIFLGASVLSTCITLGFNIYRFATLPSDNDEFVFAIVVLINLFFAFLYILDGVFREQYFEIWAVILTTILLVCYVVLNFFSGKEPSDQIKLVRLCISAIIAPPVLVVGAMLSRHYVQTGFLIFRTVGARADLQKACHLLYSAQTLLAFNAQAMASLLALVLKGGLSPSEETATLAVGGVLTGLWLILGYLAMRYENRRATALFLFLSLGQWGFVIWRFYETPLQFNGESVLYKSAFMAGVTTLLVNMALVINTILVYRNFGKGLRQKVYQTIPGRNFPTRK